MNRIIAILLLWIVAMPTWAQTADYPADYARAPRFKVLFCYDPQAEPDHVTFDHQALRFFHKLSYGEGFLYDVTTNLDSVSQDQLMAYNLLVMLNAQPSRASRGKVEYYMEHGGGWMGFHAAAYNDSRTDWPWLNQFLGCGPFLCNNWPPQNALAYVDAPAHCVMRNLPQEMVLPASEFYQWKPSPRLSPDVEVLLSLSDKNYPLGIKDIVYWGDFPIVWTNKRYRMIYLNFGHGDDEFSDATQNLLVTNAFRFVAMGM